MSSNPLIYVLDPYHPDAIALLQASPNFDVVLPTDPRKQSQPWHEHATAILVRSETRVTPADLDRARQAGLLRAVVKQGVGVDNIDLAAAEAAGVGVYNTPGVNSEAVAEMSLALVLGLTRRVTEFDRRARRGEKIVRSEMLGISLFRKTVGIVGMGNVGKAAARKWIAACESAIIGYDPIAPVDVWEEEGIPHRRVRMLEELLREADVVTLHLPLLETTRGLIGAKELDMMKSTAVLVNASRGGIVEEKALLEALKEKKIWGAVLDAMEVEPAHPDSHGDWFELDNIIITPHVGASTEEMQSLSGVTAAQTLMAVLEGRADFPGKRVV